MNSSLTLEFGDRFLQIEVNKVARQSEASVLVRYGDTVLLITCIWEKSKEKRDFLPLLVEYREQAYAAGKIPGGYYKREGKPREREILYGRAIDRALRPLFPRGMTDDLEIILYLLSYDMENEAHVLGIIGSSLALMVSEIPFNGPVSAVRLGRINGQWIINPTNSQMQSSELDLLVAGTNKMINMIEFTGKEVNEKIVLEGIEFALPIIEELNELQNQARELYGRLKVDPTLLIPPQEIVDDIEVNFSKEILDTLLLPLKRDRRESRKNLENKILTYYSERFPDMELEIKEAIFQIEKKLMRKMILEKGIRIDSRSIYDIRPISVEVGILPRTHGSALFTRGETQALVVTTLGTQEDVQFLSELDPEEKKRFMLHYNFPPFSTGEISPLRGPSRREIGHGALAEKAILPLLPSEDEFPYVIRVVSDILESNGSTSMATVCGASLSLMDAGVPIKTSCAGISIGLIKENDKYVLLTDIIGDEDHMGDMDFKIAGTRKGITAIQLDLKIDGLPLDVVAQVFERARQARESILDIMDATLPSPRKSLSQYAPKVKAMFIPKEKIGIVIGTGGKTIKSIIEKTQTKVDIDDSTGRVLVAGPTEEAVEEAQRMIKEIIEDVEVGKVYMGKVTRLASYGIFVEILPGKEGLVHISEISNEKIKDVHEIAKEGDYMLVKVIGIDELGRIKLSRKQAISEGLKKLGKIRE